jgi:hypothetical protein
MNGANTQVGPIVVIRLPNYTRLALSRLDAVGPAP